MKAVVGFSGGVDSAVTTALLRDAGYDVYGLYMDNSVPEALQDAIDGAERLGIPLKVIDVKAELEKHVCSYFTGCYASGRTPIPCVVCNPLVKFRVMTEYADEIGAEKFATGHYAVVENGRLYKSKSDNDQSYMLCRLTRPQLERLLLPLGNLPKSEVRTIAEGLGLPVASKPDSMEICFIPDKDHIAWLERRGVTPPPGNFVFNGQVVGRHEGIHRYTVGQRRPGLIGDRKVYISRINAAANEIELSLWEDLFKTELRAEQFNPLCDLPEFPFRAKVKVRHTKWECPECTVYSEGDLIRIVCDDPVRAPAPGQSAVLYDIATDMVIGGGFII